MPKPLNRPIQTVGDLLRESLAEKRKKNSSYSARALARDLKVSPAFLSMIFTGKKKLSLDRAEIICNNLGLKGRKRSYFLRTVAVANVTGHAEVESVREILFEPPSSQDFVALDVDRFQFFSQWYHVAVMDLATCQDFSFDLKWISDRLGITPEMTAGAIDRLVRLGLLAKDGKSLKKTTAEISVPTTKSHQAIRNFHGQMIEKAKEALQSQEQGDFINREISGLTMAVDPSRIAEAKNRIKQFKREMYELLASDDAHPTEVFQLNIQLFPLTKRTSGDQS